MDGFGLETSVVVVEAASASSTTCSTGSDVSVVPPPSNRAVSVWVPTASVDTNAVALPDGAATVASSVAPSKKVTVPAGTSVPPAAIVAVSSTVSPKVDGFGLDVSSTLTTRTPTPTQTVADASPPRPSTTVYSKQSSPTKLAAGV